MNDSSLMATTLFEMDTHLQEKVALTINDDGEMS